VREVGGRKKRATDTWSSFTSALRFGPFIR